MKNTATLFVLILTSGILNAQSILDTNNSKASLTDNGIMFNSGSQPGYEMPKGSGNHLIFSGAMWYGGVDANGIIKLAVNDLYASSQDVWPGPLTIGTAYPMPNGSWAQTMWTVSKNEIEYHLHNFQNAGYVTPADIASWPAHGDVALGFDFYLAPFVDSDLDGVYNPSVGDYPCIKGDRATFFIMNDKANAHGSGAFPIGLELHYMYYQYDQPGDVGNTTFMDVKLINRGNQTLYDFVTSLVLDGDLGNPFDDYFGCDSTRNLQYYYNDIDDEQGQIGSSYGLNPPSFGVVCLSDDITSAIDLQDAMGLMPNSAMGKYNVMRGYRANGATVTTPNFTPTNFEYFDDPNNPTGNSQLGWMQSPGGKRTIMNIHLGTLTPSLEKELTYAIVYNRSGNDNLENVTGLFQTTDAIQAFFDSSTDGDCSQSILGNAELHKTSLDVQLFPNPTNGQFTLVVENANEFQYSITDMAGRNIVAPSAGRSGEKINLDVPAGAYFVSIQTEKGSEMKRLIVR